MLESKTRINTQHKHMHAQTSKQIETDQGQLEMIGCVFCPMTQDTAKNPGVKKKKKKREFTVRCTNALLAINMDFSLWQSLEYIIINVVHENIRDSTYPKHTAAWS